MVVYHLHHLEEVVFPESLEAVGQFVHVDLLMLVYFHLHTHTHLHEIVDLERRTFFSVRFFFLDPSSPPAARLDFIPFSSPGTGPVSRRAANNAGLGFLNVMTCLDS